MESNKNKNNNNNDAGNEHQQLRGSAQKRKSNKLANDEDKPAATGDDDQNCRTNKNLEERNDLDLEVESLSREELIKLVRKQMATIMDQKQLETIKKEAEESASLQAEEFAQRILQLEKEKAKVHEQLHQKMGEILEMHKEIEEKSEEVAEKAKQIDALLIQLNKSTSHQHQMHQKQTQTERQMKIQLSLETWFDMLAFVPRRQLGQIVPKIGHRKFASIAQKFLHEYGEFMIDEIEIVAPYAEDPQGPHPRVREWQNCRQLTFEMAKAQIPTNIKNFHLFSLRYFDQSVLNFMQKFQQNGLLDNVNLYIWELSKGIVQPVLCHLLPMINGINSILVRECAQLVDIYDAENSKEIYEMNMKMMEETRLLSTGYDPENLHTKTIDLYCRWLYQTTCTDGKPRVLSLRRFDMDYSPISLFIDRIKQDFLMAINSITFLIRIDLREAFQQLEAICLDNDKTNERLHTKMEVIKTSHPHPDPDEDDCDCEEVVLLISRYPLASTKKWIVENEKEVLNWEFCADKTIYLCNELRVVAI